MLRIKHSFCFRKKCIFVERIAENEENTFVSS